MAKSKYLIDLEALQKEFEEYKQKVSDTVKECLNEYGLDVCQDGLDDFASRLGLPDINPITSYQVTVTYTIESKSTADELRDNSYDEEVATAIRDISFHYIDIVDVNYSCVKIEAER